MRCSTVRKLLCSSVGDAGNPNPSLLVLIQAANLAKVHRQASCGPRHQTVILSLCHVVQVCAATRIQLSFDGQLHRIPGRLTSCVCRPAMVFAAPALALSFSVRSKDPNGSATDAGTFTATGCKSTIAFAVYVNSDFHDIRATKERWKLDLCVAPLSVSLDRSAARVVDIETETKHLQWGLLHTAMLSGSLDRSVARLRDFPPTRPSENSASASAQADVCFGAGMLSLGCDLPWPPPAAVGSSLLARCGCFRMAFAPQTLRCPTSASEQTPANFSNPAQKLTPRQFKAYLSRRRSHPPARWRSPPELATLPATRASHPGPAANTAAW